MAKQLIQRLLGRTITKVSSEDGSLGIEFDNNISLSIYNLFRIVNDLGLDLDCLVGLKVIGIQSRLVELRIFIETEIELVVDLTDKGYVGPEAVQLIVPGEPITIWN